MHPVLLMICAAALVGAVLTAVHHAEVVAHHVGEPFGTLVLAVAVTVIEVALIVSLMLSGGAEAAALPRDTLYAAIMIICNGVVGICLLVGGLSHHEQSFQIAGTGLALRRQRHHAEQRAHLRDAGRCALVVFAAFLFLALVP